MANTRELLERKKSLAAEIRKLADKSNAPERVWTESDDALWKKTNSEFDAISSQLTASARAEQIDRDLANFSDTTNLAPGQVAPGSESRAFSGCAGPADALEARALLPNESCRDYVLKRKPEQAEFKDLTLGQTVRAMIRGPKNDLERRALSEGSDAAGGYAVPDILSASVIDKMRAQAVTLQAGVTVIPLLSDVQKYAKILTDPVVAWRAENAAVTESDPVFAAVTFAPKSLGILFKASVELAQDAVSFDQTIEQLIVGSMSAEIDRAVLEGTGASNQPTGIALVTTGNGANEDVTLGANGGTIANYDPILALWQQLLEDNIPIERLNTLVMAPRSLKQLAALKEGTTNGPLAAPEPIRGMRKLVTTGCSLTRTKGTSTDCSNVYLCDWPQIALGFRSQITIRRLVERYADTGQIGFVALARCDVQAFRNEAIGRVVGLRP